MNIVSVTNALKEIKIKQLDDEFQIALIQTLNESLPDGFTVSAESSGTSIRKMFDEDIGAIARAAIMSSNVFSDTATMVRFYNNVEKVQESQAREVQYGDAIKGSVISNFGILAIIIVLTLMGIYLVTVESRGYVPESKTLSAIEYVLSSLAGNPLE